MKKLYVLAGALLASTSVFAQGTDLFFSAYSEGAHPNGSVPPNGTTPSQGSERALQIFNPTTAIIDMGQYSVARYSNGSSTVFQEEQTKRNFANGVPAPNAPNTLTSGDVFVIGAFKATLPEILNNADQISSDYNSTNPTVLTTGGPVTFDGNDAMVLRRWTGGVAGQGTPVIVDIFGVIGHDPGPIGWLSNVTVGGTTQTVKSTNQSLKRKGIIENGTKTNPNSATYEIGDEWETVSAWNSGTTPADYFGQSYANLVSHSGDFTGNYGSYAPLGVLEDFDKGINVYPNPASRSKEVTIEIKKSKVASVTIINALGQNINVTPTNAAQQEIKVNVSSLKPGMYFVKFVSADDYKMTVYKTLIVQ
ncbi:T9SS type A sorting domain-containing protein [Adhaeribacter soli]|uniref:T9SS type A sorting domain-containing protein n=1 Tax=Adhaeribacter soli TaxID=2607655 RepID=A0A5N1IU69_9BACT|nr:T9SS type A sorting domain-containing protein [Adhaeribacter soli]KAA9332656.1 T9SS type A sorting domain-containing protein [Adhaeribacter soli]